MALLMILRSRSERPEFEMTTRQSSGCMSEAVIIAPSLVEGEMALTPACENLMAEPCATGRELPTPTNIAMRAEERMPTALTTLSSLSAANVPLSSSTLV